MNSMNSRSFKNILMLLCVVSWISSSHGVDPRFLPKALQSDEDKLKNLDEQRLRDEDVPKKEEPSESFGEKLSAVLKERPDMAKESEEKATQKPIITESELATEANRRYNERHKDDATPLGLVAKQAEMEKIKNEIKRDQIAERVKQVGIDMSAMSGLTPEKLAQQREEAERVKQTGIEARKLQEQEDELRAKIKTEIKPDPKVIIKPKLTLAQKIRAAINRAVKQLSNFSNRVKNAVKDGLDFEGKKTLIKDIEREEKNIKAAAKRVDENDEATKARLDKLTADIDIVKKDAEALFTSAEIAELKKDEAAVKTPTLGDDSQKTTTVRPLPIIPPTKETEETAVFGGDTETKAVRPLPKIPTSEEKAFEF